VRIAVSNLPPRWTVPEWFTKTEDLLPCWRVRPDSAGHRSDWSRRRNPEAGRGNDSFHGPIVMLSPILGFRKYLTENPDDSFNEFVNDVAESPPLPVRWGCQEGVVGACAEPPVMVDT